MMFFRANSSFLISVKNKLQKFEQMFAKSIDKVFLMVYNEFVIIKEEIKWQKQQMIKH